MNRWKSISAAVGAVPDQPALPQLHAQAADDNGQTDRLPEGYDVDKHFNPNYKPWDQRLCLVPNGDLFRTIRHGQADVVTDTIDRFTETGIRLSSGEQLTADIIVTATGLNVQLFGGAGHRAQWRARRSQRV